MVRARSEKSASSILRRRLSFDRTNVADRCLKNGLVVWAPIAVHQRRTCPLRHSSSIVEVFTNNTITESSSKPSTSVRLSLNLLKYDLLYASNLSLHGLFKREAAISGCNSKRKSGYGIFFPFCDDQLVHDSSGARDHFGNVSL